MWCRSQLITANNLRIRSPLHDVRQPASRDRTIDAIQIQVHGRTLMAQPGLPSRSRGAAKAGGARRDRTDDLLLAKQALSQLSYGPGYESHALKMVGLGRLELPTSRLSSARSNQLSYKPKTITVIRPAGIPSRMDENTARARP